MKMKCDNFVHAAMTPIPPKAEMGATIREALDWRFKELMSYGKWKLPDYREIALSGERLYVNGDRVEMDAVRILSGPRLQSVLKISSFLFRFS